MTTFAVLASGPSMSRQLADYVRGKCRVVAVSDAYRLAAWADALVSNDRNWWNVHPDAMKFAGQKFCGGRSHGTQHLPFDPNFGSGVNSGLQGVRVAKLLGATRILLLGFDLSASAGAHFFGNHPAPLRNTAPARFRAHISQFRNWRGPEVINCTPNSALKQFRFMSIEEALPESPLSAMAS
jgi:hypothetical protein